MKKNEAKSDFRAVKVKECVAVPKSKKLLQFTLDDGTGTDRTILSGIHAYYEPEELVGKTLIAITKNSFSYRYCVDNICCLRFNWFSDAHPFELIVMERQIPVCQVAL